MTHIAKNFVRTYHLCLGNLKGNCAPEKPFDFSYLPKKTKKIMTFAKNRRSKSFLDQKLWQILYILMTSSLPNF